jgi:N-acetylneuraminic acid mutarotase
MIRLRLAHIIPLAALALGGGLMAAPASAATSGTFTVTGSMNAASYLNTATVLPDGEVLVVGDGTTSAELYNPATGTWSLTGSMHVARVFQTATLLPDGNVLVAGGGETGAASAELYNPATGTWTLTGSLHTNRLSATATLLPDGEVLVAGGVAGGSTYQALSSAELYNPATGTWTLTGSMTAARNEQTATLLANGKVLVAGGLGAGATALSSAELYNPSTGTWTATGSMSAARANASATLLPNGDVLATAGIGGAAGPFAELFSPATGRWSPAIGGSLNLSCIAAQDCRYLAVATLLGDGEVLVAGGFIGTASNPSSSTSALLYNPASGTWTTTGSLNTGRIYQTASLLADGQVLVAGGEGFAKHKSTILASAELYTP